MINLCNKCKKELLTTSEKINGYCQKCKRIGKEKEENQSEYAMVWESDKGIKNIQKHEETDKSGSYNRPVKKEWKE